MIVATAQKGAQRGGSIPTMVGAVRKVAPIRKMAQGGADGAIETKVETAKKEVPQGPVKAVPLDPPQVPAGVGRPRRAGAPGRAIGKDEAGQVVNSAGEGDRQFKEELEVAKWFGGSAAGSDAITRSSPSCVTIYMFQGIFKKN